jgi:dienelactone hydrolase
MKFVIRGLVKAGILWAVCNAAMGQTFEYNSLDRKQGFPTLLAEKATFTDKINGAFTRPTGGAAAGGPVPVMVIMHSSAGMSPISTGEWSDFFLRMGVATFVVDSFGPRGITSTANDQTQLTYAATTADALLALKTVAALPNVDATKIGVIGFSRGGMGALNSSYSRVIASVLGKQSTLKFALHIPFYPGCYQVGTPNQQPILYFVGDDDDYYPIAKCNAVADTLKAKGANLKYIVYPGAKHAFDLDRPKVYAARAQQLSKCGLTIMDLDDMSYHVDNAKVTAKEFSDYVGKCMTTGLTVGPDPKAKKDSREKVEAFVRKNFAM